MSVASIKKRISLLEGDRGIGRRPIVVILPGQTEDSAYAKAGIEPGRDAHVIRVNYVSARAA